MDPEGSIRTMVDALDRATEQEAHEECCRGVKEALIATVAAGNGFLAPRFGEPIPDRYARRLLHLDPEMRYSVVVMAWGGRQGTPIHDHGGLWCVECVYQGRIRVTSYRRTSPRDAPVMHFATEKEILAEVGEAGALIPPFEFHTLENATPEPAVTIHVYGGELINCNTYEPDGTGGYLRRPRELGYDL
jgi:predicted metal-dependent enzyme (double-stranded beta helix superfamily)